MYLFEWDDDFSVFEVIFIWLTLDVKNFNNQGKYYVLKNDPETNAKNT